jgi:signal transduction histidine kinase
LKKITSRFAMLLATAGIVPLLAYGVVSIYSLRSGTRQSVVTGNVNVAKRAAEQIQLYIDTNIKILQALGSDLENTNLEAWQQERILKNYLLEFPEFREITLFDAAGGPVATSRVGKPQLRPDLVGTLVRENVTLSPITVDDDLLPTGVIGIRLKRLNQATGWLQGELRLEEMWRMVDRIRVGEHGFALVVVKEGQLIAHGDPNQKPRVAQGDNLQNHPLVQELQQNAKADTGSEEFTPAGSSDIMLAAGAPIRSLGWTVIVEQPASEAYAVANQLGRQLIFVIGLALLTTVLVGYWWGRQFIRPIFALMRGTQAVAEGRLDERVEIKTQDEFQQLGDAFNGMADKLVELQEDVKRKERQAIFGRIAVGLVHDLSHPIQNIGNSCRLLMKVWDDLEYRETFKRTVEREFVTVKRVLEDLRHLARPMPLERFPIDVTRSVLDVVESMRTQADTAGLTLYSKTTSEELFMEGDLFALGRVYRNLITNALQATSPGGTVTVTTARIDDMAHITVSDTGCGIAAERLAAIFDDFVTTKRRGLGLGLAISKKIVEQLGGTIAVASELNKGTTFTMKFPTIEPKTEGTGLSDEMPAATHAA